MYCITNFFHNVSVEWKMPLMQCVALCMESQSMGMGKFQSPPHKINTPEPIDKKFGTTDYVRKGSSYTKFGRNPSTGGFWENG